MENIQKKFEILNNNILEINNGESNTLESNTLKGIIEGFDEVVNHPNLQPTWTACLRNVKPLSGQQHAKIQKVINTIINTKDFSPNSKASLMGVLKEELGIDVDKSRGDDNTPMIIHLPKPPEPEHAATEASFQATTTVGPQKAQTMQSTTQSVLDPLKPAATATAAKPAAKLKLQENTFETVTRMMTQEQLQAVLDESAGREKQINDLSRILQLEKGNWQAIWQGIISRYKEEGPDFLAKDGLIAFRDGSITMEQFCTLTTCWSLMKEFPNSEIQVQPLFDAEGNPVSHAKDSFKSSIYIDAERNFFRSKEAEEITNVFFENMKTKSPSEKVFFSINSTGDGVIDPDPESLGTALKKTIGFRACNFFVDESSQEKRMVPSFSMVQACVDACGQENTIAPSPVIGYSTSEDIYDNIVKRGREVLLPFPGRTYDERGEIIHPITADNHPVRSYMDFYLHDLYHCVLVSYVPDGCRQETARLAKMVEFSRKQYDINSFNYHFFNELYDRLVDMDFTIFIPDSQQALQITDGELFLCQLQYIVKAALVSLQEKPEIRNSPRRQLEYRNLVNFSPIFSQIVDTFCDNEGFFTKYPCRPEIVEWLSHAEFFNLAHLAPNNASILDQSFKRLSPPGRLSFPPGPMSST